MSNFRPEGRLMDTPENKQTLHNIASLQDAMNQNRILEARALLCDAEHNLIVDLGLCKGKIPRAEAAIGIEGGQTRDIAIISRVNKPVCFVVTGFEKADDGSVLPILSRRKAQELCTEQYIGGMAPGDILDARVTHLEPFGCFVDIGCGIASLIPIDAISISRISHPRGRFHAGQDIRAIVRSRDENGRINLSHKELLGTWEENAANFTAGQTVAGIIRSVENYGVFVELTPNLAGLAEPREGVAAGQHASAYIKSLLPEKMKIKLIIVDAFDADYTPEPMRYYTEAGHMDQWIYSPPDSERVIETVFE